MTGMLKNINIEMKKKYVYCIIPCFNRIEAVKNCYKQLKEQTYEDIKIIIINDGSTDGTYEYLNSIEDKDSHFITGDGNLWWGRSINKGLGYISRFASNEDYILLLNDDTFFDKFFIQNFVTDLESYNSPTLLSAYMADCDTKEITHVGYSIDFFKTKISTIMSFNDDINIDALPARALLFSVSVFKRIGFINTFLFRQAFGDLEYTSRAAEKGVKLRASKKAVVYTKAKTSDDNQMSHSFFARLTSRYTTNSFLLRLLFFTVRGPLLLRLLSLPRFIFYRVSKNLDV